MEDQPKEKPYYRTLTEKHPILEKAIEALDARTTAYERQHTVLHRQFVMAVQGNGFIVAMNFCCETEPGETY